MSVFRQAEQKAAGNIVSYRGYDGDERLIEEYREQITPAYSSIEQTYALLCELAALIAVGRVTGGYQSPHWMAEVNKKLDHPLIVAAIAEGKE